MRLDVQMRRRIIDLFFAPAAPAAPAEAGVASGHETVLLVEDDPTIRDVTRVILEEFGYAVIEAGHPEDALRLASGDEHIDLLLTDVVMPGFRGPELFRRLHAMRPDLRVLFMSSYPHETFKREGLGDAAVPFLLKPFTGPGLLQRVRHALDEADPIVLPDAPA